MRLSRRLVVPLVCFGLVIAALAASPPGPRSATVFLAGHPFGQGEQQVYAIAEHVTLNVRLRQPDGRVVRKTLNVDERHSVAFTIEGYAQGGAPVMALAGAHSGKHANKSPSPAPAASPAVGANGSLPMSGESMALAPAALVLSGLSGRTPALGVNWKSAGVFALPFGSLAIDFANAVGDSSSEGDSTTLQVASSGVARVSGKARIASIGLVSLHGGMPATGASFLEMNRRLLLGMVLHASGSGNASTPSGHVGSYTLAVDYAIKLMRFTAGAPAQTPATGFVPASGYLGGIAATDAGNLSPAPANTIAQPAPTDTSFVPSPLPAAAATATPGPGESLPPVPILMPSGIPLASPPPAPSPSPS